MTHPQLPVERESHVCSNVFTFIFCIFCPPLAVAIASHNLWDVLLNIGLTILGAIPGIIHAFYVFHTLVKRRKVLYATGSPPPNDPTMIFSSRIRRGGG